jgi:RNA polymerase sigma factor (sigma-70 family)
MCKIICEKVHSDRLRAEIICREIQQQKTDHAFIALFEDYQRFFVTFAKKYLYNPQQAEDVVQDFWVELANGRAICNYEGRNNATLRTFLTKILIWRIITVNKKNDRGDIERQPEPHELSDGIHQQFMAQLVNSGLETLAEKDSECAQLIHMHMKGFSFKQMAAEMLKSADPPPEKMLREINRIKPKVNKKGTGVCQKKLKSIIKKQLLEKKLEFD